ncbi:MAG: integrase family protein [Xanthomonadales bacterium]|nr:integrase family protein [Xanthomonadales bacterium]
MPKTLSASTCRSEPAPESGQKIVTDGHKDAPAGFGLRITAAGARSFVLSYVTADRKQRRLTIGPFPDLSPEAARRRARELRAEILLGADPLAEKRAAAAEREAEAERGTVGKLLGLYADALEAQGKASAAKVRKALQLHVRDALPKVWGLAAADFQPEHAVEVLARLHAAGKDREAAKVRAYLRAAFARAVRARLDPKAATDLRAMALRVNPVADLPPSETPTGTRERALSVEELRCYWRRLQSEPEPYGAMLRLHLLSGAQRVEQMGRLTLADWDRDAQTITLRDSKGRRAKPRAHIVPLLDRAADALRAMRPVNDAKGAHLFTANKGKTGAGYHVARLRVARIAAAMKDAGEASEPFTLGDLRRTVETRLAAAGVSLEVRAQLQSHGLGGVQAKHYDRHSYGDEKRAALLLLLQILEGESASVTPIAARRRGGAK